MRHSKAALAAASLALCVAGRAPVRAATPPDRLVVAQIIDDIVSLDPAEGYELSSTQVFTSTYQRLISPSRAKAGDLDPALAVSWQPGADGHSLVFALKPGAVFSSGNPVRPEDVVFSLARAVKLNKSPAFILNTLGWEPETVDAAVSKVDADHVRLSWSAKVGTGFVLNLLTAPVASVVDQTVVMQHSQADDMGNAWLRNHSAGSGPFSIRTYQPHEAVVLDANPSSPAGAPLLKGVVLRNVADPVARRILIEQGDADIARDLGSDQIGSLRGHAGVTVVAEPSAAIYYMILNAANHDVPVLANPALWQASRWLIDYDGIANTLLKGQYKVHQAFLPDGIAGALDDTPYHLDVAKAKDILAKAGLHDVHFHLNVLNQPPFTDIGQAMQASFAKAGVTLDVQPMVGTELYSKLRSRNSEASLLYWFQDYLDAHSTAGAFAFNPDDKIHTVAWRAGWVIPALSQQTQAAVEEPDPAKRATMYLAIQRVVQSDSPFVIAFQGQDLLAMRSNVAGYAQGLDPDMAYFDKVTK